MLGFGRRVTTLVVLREKVRAVRSVVDIDGMTAEL